MGSFSQKRDLLRDKGKRQAQINDTSHPLQYPSNLGMQDFGVSAVLTCTWNNSTASDVLAPQERHSENSRMSVMNPYRRSGPARAPLEPPHVHTPPVPTEDDLVEHTAESRDWLLK